MLNASIFIPLILQSIRRGMLAKITLTKLTCDWFIRVSSNLDIKKDDPQITANRINSDKSKVFASLISSLNCMYVINA